MFMQKLFCSLLILYFSLTSVFAQGKFLQSFTGKVLDAESGKPMEMVYVRIPALNLWTMTNGSGRFSISKLKPGRYQYEISFIGYETYIDSITVKPKTGANTTIRMNVLTLALKEVTVTAKEKRSGSTSKIDANAIQHLQPKSVEDLLQLVPGNVTNNPDLNAVGQAQIREIGSNGSSALGTAVVVNGSPLSNDGNMQSVSTAKQGTTINNYDEQGTAGRGTDLRILSPDNIESLEVIRGIPSVEYGNLTSGAVVIKTKRGYTPLEVKVKVDPNSKMYYVGKGLRLGDKAGSLNLTADYSQSYDDIRMKYKGYDRITAGVTYTNRFLEDKAPLTFHVDFNFYNTLNNNKSDPQMLITERVKNENTGYRLNLESKWSLNKSWITNATFNGSLNFTRQKDFRHERITLQSGLTPISDALVSGEYESRFQKSAYYSDYTIMGKPLDVFLQLKADKLFQFEHKSYNIIMAGIEERFNKNYGSGLTFDPLYPPTVNSNQSVRPRPYSDIPAMNQLTGFIQDKWHQNVGTKSFTLQAGMRFTNLFIDEKRALRDDIFEIEPRVNLELNLLNRKNNEFFDNFTLFGGYGITTKMPTMLFLYPDKAYFDATSLAVYNTNIAKSIMTTTVVDNTANKDLKATRNHKIEFGLSGNHRKRSFNITLFSEHSDNDFGFANVPIITPYRKFSVPAGVTSLTYDKGTLWYEDATGMNVAPFNRDTVFNTYMQPSNRIQTKKRGLEYTFNLGEIKALRTSVVIDGAYLWIKRRTNATNMSVLNTVYAGKLYPYMPVFPAGSGSVNERFNTNVRFITHIPNLKMVFSTTAQIIWCQKARSIYEDNDGRTLQYFEVNSQTGADGRFFIDPIGFYNHAGEYYAWKTEYRQDNVLQQMRSVYSAQPDAFGCESYPTTVLLNFRLTKEMGRMLELSFLANNFLKFTKLARNKTTVGYTQMMIPLYFGAELKLKL